MTLLVTSCAGESSRARDPGDPTHAGVELALEPLVALRDDSLAILARPEGILVDSQGRFLIVDRSDADIKVYDSAGQRVGNIGRSGSGPGEFKALSSALLDGDDLVAFDMVGGRLTQFSSAGDYVSSRPLAEAGRALRVRAIDDSLMLVTRSTLDHHRDDLLVLLRRDGSRVGSMFNRSSYFVDDPQLIQHSVAPIADARGGVIFATLYMGDSIFAFDYHGNRLAAAALQAGAPIRSLKALLKENQGRIRRPSGDWIFKGERVPIRIIALADSSAVMQVARFDEGGIDLVEGGEYVYLRLQGDRLVVRGHARLEGGLLGHAPDGSPLVLAYAAHSRDRYVVNRLIFSPLRRR